MSSLPDPRPFEESGPPSPRSPWSIADLVVFGFVFFAIVLLVPAGIVRVWHTVDPDLRVADIPPTAQVLIQGLIDLATLGFIAFLIKVVHRQSFLETIHWRKNHEFGTAFLVSFGATLAISVLIISSFFPSGEPPIQKLLTSTTAMYVFVVFGIVVAPLFEEIMFRGFLFKVLSDIRGEHTAVLLTAILFGLLHLPQLWGSWAGVVLIFVVGYLLSFIRQRSNSVIPSFIVHTSYNSMLFGAFVLSTLAQKVAH
jgi:membrane protease YdiL (CAAX protease family)